MNKILFYYFIIINLISFLFFYVDKRRAIKHKWRIKESTLILLCILGGSIGGLFSMYLFHHKTRHIKFKLGVPFILILQFILFYILIAKK